MNLTQLDTTLPQNAYSCLTRGVQKMIVFHVQNNTKYGGHVWQK